MNSQHWPSGTEDVRPPALAGDLVCLSHLRWDFVFQRPQQLMTRFATRRRVLFVEEPLFDAAPDAEWLEEKRVRDSLRVLVPHLEADAVADPRASMMQRALLDRALATHRMQQFILWYWTPMALRFTRHLSPSLVVFDCMDELSGFAGAPAELVGLERELLARADVVFTGGHSLYEAKASRHGNVHAFPSSVDVPHFARARHALAEPDDQRTIPHPRLGFFGVIDERMDLNLVAAVAARRPDWHWVLVGPIAKIEPSQVPSAPNIHVLGMKSYDALPQYLSGWDVAVLPFARNAATRFISPTKTPEYLAAGCAVVSTAIHDVVHPYGEQGLVHIADDVDGFVTAVEAALGEKRDARLISVDRFLAGTSWDAVVEGMEAKMAAASVSHTLPPAPTWPGAVHAAPFAQGAWERPL